MILILDLMVYSSLFRTTVLDLLLENYGVKIFSSDSGVTLSLESLSLMELSSSNIPIGEIYRVPIGDLRPGEDYISAY